MSINLPFSKLRGRFLGLPTGRLACVGSATVSSLLRPVDAEPSPRPATAKRNKCTSSPSASK